jgi:transposase InsO family protein
LKRLGIYTPRGHDGASALSGPRGPEWQHEQRTLEQQVRNDVIDFTVQTRAQGWLVENLAQRLGLAARTVRSWCQRLRHTAVDFTPLGRPTKRAPLPVRQALLEVLDELGPAVSVADLRGQFPEMGRRELEDFLARYRRVWRCQHTDEVSVLRWPQPGTVWAMDFTELPLPIDGRYPYLLAVRDLASGQQLLAWPTADLTEQTARRALSWLFATQGTPLLMKMDNGSAFRAGAAQDYLRPWGITSLFSPPRMPRYNGAIEAGIGSLKTRMARLAAHHGHPGQWTYDDVEAARLEANATARPRGPNGPTPDQAWAARSPISADARLHFQATVACYRQAELARVTGAGPGTLTGADWESLWTQKEFAGEDRRSVSRALEVCGYLLISRRRIHLPIPTKKTASDS